MITTSQIVHNLNILKNSDYEATITLLNDDKTPMDISDLNAKMIVRSKNKHDSDLLFTEVCEIVENSILIKIKHDVSQSVEQHDGYYNIILFNDADDVKYRVVEGRVIFLESLDNDS